MNVPLPVTVIFNPSRAVSDAEPKISHPILAACADATTLADNSSARGVAGAAVGAPLSHARATAIATRPKNLASHLLEFIVPPCRCQHEPHDASDPGPPGTAAHECAGRAPGCGANLPATARSTRAQGEDLLLLDLIP